MLLNLALPIGLAQTADYEGKIQDAHYNELMMKRVKDEQEAKAKMFADDTDYNNAMNSFDNPVVKQFAQAKIKEIGAFVNANPDWQSNVNKRIQYKQLIKDLKDNPDLNRGLASDKSYAELQKDMADAKNANLDFKPMQEQWENYRKFGNQFATDEASAAKLGKVAFTYKAPAAPAETAKFLADIANKTEFDQSKPYQYGGRWEYLSDFAKQQAAENAIADRLYGPELKKDYVAYLAKLEGNDQTKAKSINEFVLERMKPYFKSDKFDKGFEPNQPAAPRGSGDKQIEDAKSTWYNMILGKNGVVETGQKDFTPQAMQVTFGNKDGELNLSNAIDPMGKALNLGMKEAKATGKVIIRKGYPPMYEASVILSPDEFEKLSPDHNSLIDEAGIGQITPGASKNPNWNIRNSEKAQGYQKVPFSDKGSNYSTGVQFNVFVPFDPKNDAYALNYAHAVGASPHKEDATNEEATSNKVYHVTTQAEYDKVPKGAKVIDSQGNVGIKK